MSKRRSIMRLLLTATTAMTMLGCVAAVEPSGTPATSSGAPDPSEPVSALPSPSSPLPTDTIVPPIIDPDMVFQVGLDLVTFDGRHRFTVPEGEHVYAVDGTRAFTISSPGDNNTVIAVYDIILGRRVDEHTIARPVSVVVFTAANIWLEDDGAVIRFDMTTGAEDRVIDPRTKPPGWSRAGLMSSPSGRTVASSGAQHGSDGFPINETRIVDVVDTESGTLRATFEHEGTNLVALNDDAIIATDGNFTEAYRIDTGERIWEVRPERATLPSDVTADGTRLVVPVFENDAWTIDVIEMDTGARLNRCPIEPLTKRIPLASDPQFLLMRDGYVTDLVWLDLVTCATGTLQIGGGTN